MRGISWLVEELLAFQEELFCLKSVIERCYVCLLLPVFIYSLYDVNKEIYVNVWK